MTIRNYSFPIVFCFLLTRLTIGLAQDKMPVKFGKVTPQDFTVTAAAVDTSADVVIVADFGSSTFDGNSKGWFDLQFHRSRRMRILKRTGFDAATIERNTFIYVGATESEKITGLESVHLFGTLEDGKGRGGTKTGQQVRFFG